MVKKLYKSENDKVIAGVIGGIGEYLNVDPTFLRVIWVFIVFFTALIPGLLAYIVAAMLVPRPPKGSAPNSV